MDKEIKPKYGKVKKYGMIGALAVLIVAAVVLAIGKVGESTYKVDADTVTTAEVKQGLFNDFIRVNGHVETGVIVQVSALESGIVEHKWVEEGAMVQAGDIIVTLQNPNLRQQILDSESQLAEKQNMLRDTEIAMEKERVQVKQDLLNTRTDYIRKQRIMKQQETLYKERLVSREEYLQAKEDCDLARQSQALLRERQHQDSLYRQVQVSMMRESLHNMQENFNLVRQRADNLNIRASHSGQLGTLSVELGQNVGAGQQIGQINILDNYKIVVRIDEHYIDRVEPGLRGKVERQGKKYDVSLYKVYPEVADGTFRADLRLEGAMPENIRVGQTYYINLQLGEPTEAVLVPRGAFFQSTGGHKAFVLSQDGKSATLRDIKIGRQNPQYYEVLEGLEPGERIITSSYKNFGNATKLKLQ